MWLRRSVVTLVACALGELAVSSEPVRRGEQLHNADEIVRRVINQAEAKDSSDPTGNYAYRKVTTTELLDKNGKVTEQKRKVFVIRGGRADLQEMSVDGRPASDEELRREDRATREARQEVTPAKKTQKDEAWQQLITKDVISKYKFTLLRTEMLNHRPTYVLAFEPVSDDLPIRSMIDRVLNKMRGNIWVDVDEAEIAKAHVRMDGQASLGGVLKVIGALKRFEYSVERVRLARNVWFNRASQGEFEGRKLWDSNRVRTTSLSSGFREHQSAAKD